MLSIMLPRARTGRYMSRPLGSCWTRTLAGHLFGVGATAIMALWWTQRRARRSADAVRTVALAGRWRGRTGREPERPSCRLALMVPESGLGRGGKCGLPATTRPGPLVAPACSGYDMKLPPDAPARLLCLSLRGPGTRSTDPLLLIARLIAHGALIPPPSHARASY
jgi:hypothetical protein